MTKFRSHNIKEMLGFTPIAEVQDSEIWNDLLTPQVRAQLGRISAYGQAEVHEDNTGLFPGDSASNLNDHRLYGGSTEYVRFPYISTIHRTEWGALVIKRDSVKVKVTGWIGDVFAGKGELIFLAALRDRRYDGTRRANDTALLLYPYDDPKWNAPLTKDARCVEVSIYSFAPGLTVLGVTGDPDYARFIEQPFAYLDRPELFLQYFRRVWNTQSAPGQTAAPIQDVSKVFLQGCEKLVRRHRYDFLECAPSHYHVARWFLSRGYRYRWSRDEKTMHDLENGIRQVREKLKQRNIELRRPQESWIAVAQSLRPLELIPDGLYLNGPIWPQDNIGQQNLWMHKPLNERAAQLIPGPTES